MTKSLPTLQLRNAGQSPWLDYISRDLIHSGQLKSLINDKGIIGITSNPSIFEKAINQPKSGYEKDIQKLLKHGCSTFEIYDELTVKDIQNACDAFLPVFKSSKGEHGFVSLEVIPGLAYDEDGTVREAERLFKKVSRPNVMIKVPATKEGVAAVRKLIAKGININITLMFSLRHYQDVATAYIDGLAEFSKNGGDISKVHSVASVFVSRIDTLIDKQLPLLANETVDAGKKSAIQSLPGKAAVANCKVIYQEFKKIFSSPKWSALQKKGAWPQKVLWGSTSVKNPAYSDLMYVSELVGPETVNTMPTATLDALLDHGEIRPLTIESHIDASIQTIQKLKDLGFDLETIGETLQKDGAKLFCDAFDSLMSSIERLRQAYGEKKSKNDFAVQIDHATSQKESVLSAISDMGRAKAHHRFLQKDASLWKADLSHQKVINNRLGWLHSAEWLFGKLYELDLLNEELAEEGIKDVVLLGMGGSSLAAEVLACLGQKLRSQKTRLHILDTTDPGSILKTERACNLKKTVFLVASKSGTTAETVSQYRYFYERVSKLYGKGAASGKKTGRHFIAITDDGSFLQEEARKKLFRKIFVNPTDIGGRFSALSFFGMVPAALIGLPVRQFVYSALNLFRLTQSEDRLEKNPAMELGIVLGQLAKDGKNKLHLWFSPKLEAFGPWLEQLIAESTGKEGKGIIPVVGENPGQISEFGQDAVFVVNTLKGDSDPALAKKIKELKGKGFPLLQIQWHSVSDLGAEFLRWEIATSFASVVLGVNPFDEPNVKESKDITGKLLNEMKTKGRLETPKGILNFAKPADKNIKHLYASIAEALSKSKNSGYIAILAYLERNSTNQKLLRSIQTKLRKHFNRPVLFGFGPRYLHSIGQLYKGGPKTGVFIQFLQTAVKDARVPESHFKFGELIKAQAFGDLLALRDKNLPVTVCDLGKSPVSALSALAKRL